METCFVLDSMIQWLLLNNFFCLFVSKQTTCDIKLRIPIKKKEAFLLSLLEVLIQIQSMARLLLQEIAKKNFQKKTLSRLHGGFQMHTPSTLLKPNVPAYLKKCFVVVVVNCR